MRINVTKIRTLQCLGVRNIARVAWYRLALKYGVHPVVRLDQEFLPGQFFTPTTRNRDLPTTVQWQETAKLFGWLDVDTRSTPSWSVNYLSGHTFESQDLPWWKLADFSAASGDIKGFWEASRFEWVPAMAQRIAAGNAVEHDRLETWLSDWCDKNPPYRGVHWKCGQEAAIRVLHMALGSLMMDECKCHDAMRQFLRVHLRRIFPTVSYAIAQDNNHATSEAAALYVGGSWLAFTTDNDAEAKKWASAGKRMLESGVKHLVMDDGSFSQHSVNYHRLLLDTLNLCEAWRRRNKLSRFSDDFYSRAQLAGYWLRSFVDPLSGDAPNIGANDSARLFPIGPLGVRDFRGTVQLASVLFSNRIAYEKEGPWDLPLHWLSVPRPVQCLPKLENHFFESGSYGVLRQGSATAFVRCPKYDFRPSHCDAFHVDLWLGSINVFRDAGSYSYNTDDTSMAYFPGTESHNTVQFDGRDQMPRLSRFLFGDWLQPSHKPTFSEIENCSMFDAAYQDNRHAIHRRRLSLTNASLQVEDTVSNFHHSAVLRWRLPSGASIANEGKIKHDLITLEVSATVPIKRFEIVAGAESRMYGKLAKCDVLEVELQQPGILTSSIDWKPQTQSIGRRTIEQASERIHNAHPTDPPSVCVS